MGWHACGMSKHVVRSPWDQSPVGEVEILDGSALRDRVKVCVDKFEQTRRWSRAERADVLHEASRSLAARHEEFARLIVAEGGKPITLARAEVDRAVVTLRTAAEEARRVSGELIPLDGEHAGANRTGLLQKFPLGPVLAITPFNFPLNLVCHKVGPAIAAGNSVFVKPSIKTPLTSTALASLFPEDLVTVACANDEDAQNLAADSAFAFLTFTGSSQVGWMLKSRAANKKVTLELGGNSPCIVEPDADLDFAAKRIAFGGLYQAGQSCVHVQRVLAHEEIADELSLKLVAEFEDTATGDPWSGKTLNGPLITRDALDRIANWVDEAVSMGARVLTGGERLDPCYAPTIVTDVSPQMKVSCQEIFGPVITFQTYRDFDEAIAMSNDTEFGLQGALFSNDISKVLRAHREIRVGGLIHNEVSAFRVDPMPYGGVKASGEGREGLKYAIAEMSEERLLVLHDPR
jgi:acyl-CoA reductase-like NAD-dependent aldehyde dehydrogenase